MTNFFEQQKKSRLRSKKIVGVFLLFLAVQFFGFYYIYSEYIADINSPKQPVFYDYSESNDYQKQIDKKTHKEAIRFSLIISGFFILIFLFKRISLLSRPHQIPLSMGAKEITADTQDEKEKMYFNVVSEMSLASGVPMPKAYLLNRERSLNAFTSGHNYKTADITVTRGALERFTRDELQAVVAHEFGHIVSEDVKASVNLLSVVLSFSAIFSLGWYSMRALGRSRTSRSRGRVQLLLIAVVILVLGYVGFIISRLITAFFSREREYLADSLSVQFTRYPAALASALAKIRDNPFGGILIHEKGQEIASICFSSPYSSFTSLFASHPPLKNRIQRLDSSFLEVGSSFKNASDIKQTAKKIKKEPDEKVTKTFEYMMGMGVLAEDNKRAAKKTMEFLDEKDLTRYLTPHKIESLVYALLLSKEPDIRKRQEKIVFSEAGAEILKATRELFEKITSGKVLKTLSLLDLMTPSLTDLSVYTNDRVLNVTKKIIDADGKKVSFESFIFCFIKKYVSGSWRDSKSPKKSDIVYLLSRVSALSEPIDMGAKENALKFYFKNDEALKIKSSEDDSLEFVLGRLSRLRDKEKEKLVEALLIAIKFDGRVTREEFESFRVVCDFIGVPAQPISVED